MVPLSLQLAAWIVPLVWPPHAHTARRTNARASRRVFATNGPRILPRMPPERAEGTRIPCLSAPARPQHAPPADTPCSRCRRILSVPQIHSLPQLDVNVPVTFVVSENAYGHL